MFDGLLPSNNINYKYKAHEIRSREKLKNIWKYNGPTKWFSLFQENSEGEIWNWLETIYIPFSKLMKRAFIMKVII